MILALIYVVICFNTPLVGQEIFSIKLPGDPKLGEGKPENQNHAIVFTRGEAIQTIDMNQVDFLLKLSKLPSRCLVQDMRAIWIFICFNGWSLSKKLNFVFDNWMAQ